VRRLTLSPGLILLNKVNFSYVAGGVLLIAATFLYILTLDNGLRPDELTGGDLITHQYAQVEARPSNAPGYPLYTMGGWLWFKVGQVLLQRALNPIQILSLYSTLWGLASLVILYLILLKVTNRQWPIALLLTAFYATTFFFWYYTVTTEQYASAVFQTLLVIWLAFLWDETPRDTFVLWLAFISGTMLANMVTTLFILPPLLWFILFRRFPNSMAIFHYLKRPKFIIQAIGLALLPLLSYAYVYIRGVQHPEWRGVGQWPTAWAWFIQFITIQQGRDELAPGLSLNTIFTREFPSLMGQELTWLVFIGGLLGLAYLGRRRAIFLYATLAIYFVFSWGYRFGNWFQVIIPAYPIFIIGFAAGIRRISNWLLVIGEKKTGNKHSSFVIRHLWSFKVLILLGLLVYRFTVSLPQANQHNLPTDTGLNPGWMIVADNPASPAIVVSAFEERVALEYLGAVWGILPNIIPIDANNFGSISEVEQSSTLYISRKAADVMSEVIQSRELHPQAAGEQLIVLQPAPRDQLPPSANTLQFDFGNGLQLMGWEQIETKPNLPPHIAQRLPEANWQIALYWQTSVKLNDDYTISVRPLVDGQMIMAGEEAIIQDHQPVWSLYPTSRWKPNEVVRDVYALTLPPGTIPDSIQIIAYKATGTNFETLGEHTIDEVKN